MTEETLKLLSDRYDAITCSLEELGMAGSIDSIKVAYTLASKAHEGVKRKYSKLPYIIHPLSVADLALGAMFGHGCSATDTCIAVKAGLLHDVVKDTHYTYEDVRDYISGHSDSANLDKLIEVLMLLEHCEGVDYRTYVNDIINSKNIIAIVVKLCGLEHNMSDLEGGKLLSKYTRTHNKLSNAFAYLTDMEW